MPEQNTIKQSPWGAVLKGGLTGLILIFCFLLGFALRDSLDEKPLTAAAQIAAGPYSLLDEIQSLLQEYYFSELPAQTDLVYAAARGMMGALEDRYTFFNPPLVTRNESDAIAGQHGGIGVDVQYAADGRFLLYPYPDSPAAQAGIRDGDVLLAVDGMALDASMSLDLLRQMLKGDVGNDNGVTIRVRSFDSNNEREYTIAFAVIYTPSVLWRPLMEDNRIGYIHISMFTGRTPEELDTALEGLATANIEALILDLRHNPGGLLQETLAVADVFLDSGVIFYEVSRDQERVQEAAPGALHMPMIVLVNHGTASAAELLAGALQQNDRAIMIGQQTAGKGSVQLIFPLSDGSSVHITSAEWFAPDRLPLNETGLEPDIVMIPAEDGRDVELDEAIRQLRQTLE